MKKYNYTWLLLVAFIVLAACNSDDDGVDTTQEVELTAGSADFSNYVAIGNSLTAGFTDNALFIAGQQNSIPNLLAQRFALVGGGDFNQPLTNDNIGGLLLGGSPLPGFSPRLFFDGTGPAVLNAVPTTDIVANNPTGPFNNMGVPGLRSFQVPFEGLGNVAGLQTVPPTANPYFVRMASSPNASVLGDAVAQSPTFVSLWIGNNDVLGFATSGGDQTLDAITDIGTFTASVNAIMQGIGASSPQGVIANIPNVTNIPFFTTVPFAPLDPSNPSFGPLIPTLNTIYGALNGVYAFLDSQNPALNASSRAVVFSETAASPVVIFDEELPNLSAQIEAVLNGNPDFPAFLAQFGLPPTAAPLVANLLATTYGQTRQANENDLLVLTSATVIGTVNTDVAQALALSGLPAELAGQFAVEGVTLPLVDRFVLTPEEQTEIATAVDGFNTVLQSAASDAGFAFVDVNSLLAQLASTGISSGGVTLTTDLVTGAAFSLDGVHLTARGYAFVANEFLLAIDNTYGSNFAAAGSLYDIGDLPVAYPPTLQ